VSFQYLRKEELVKIHEVILSNFGGFPGILYEGSLDLCVESPQRIAYGYEPYKTLMEKAAALLYNIITLHPFIDGNKRTAYVATETFLRSNGYRIVAKKEEGVEITLKIANSNMSIKDITSWLEEHTRTY
jgi:death-on-curing protein